VPECMTHEQSFWYEILVPVSDNQNFGHLLWA